MDRGEPAEVREAFETLFGLLCHIDKVPDDVVFFADEAGSWQVGVDWDKVLPAGFTCLAKTAEPTSTRAGSSRSWRSSIGTTATSTSLPLGRSARPPNGRRFRAGDLRDGRSRQQHMRTTP